MSNPYQVVKDFEAALSDYTGAKYVVCVNSCTAALQLAVMWHKKRAFDPCLGVPRKTYPSVPMAIWWAGLTPLVRTGAWNGEYQLQRSRVWDSACRFTSGMHVQGRFQCVSFAANKILGLEQGGAILHSSPEADKWFRKMRFDGRNEGKSIMEDEFDVIGLHCPMLPSIAAQGILRLHHLPEHNDDLVFDYPDLSKHEAFK